MAEKYESTETKFCPTLIFFISVCGIHFFKSSLIVLKEGGGENKMILAGRDYTCSPVFLNLAKDNVTVSCSNWAV